MKKYLPAFIAFLFVQLLMQTVAIGQINWMPPLSKLIEDHDKDMKERKEREEKSRERDRQIYHQFYLDNISTEGSWDVAKLSEGGYSAVHYNGKSGINVSIWTAEAIAFYLNNAAVDDDDGYADNKKNAYGSSLAIAEGLEFVQKGAKDKEGDAKVTLNYLELVVDLVYQYNLEDAKGTVFGGLGPYFGYGLGGKYSGNGISQKAFGGTDGLKRFDFGLQLMAGYAFPVGMSVRLGYELGLYNKAPTDSDFTSKNRAFSVNLGYNIGRLLHK
jgi:hypothetical protein